MKFKAQPGLYVKISNKYLQRATGKKGFYFDSEGIYETDNEVLINALGQSFEVVATEPKEPEKLYFCKQCDFATGNRGSLLQHYQKIHPKEG